MQLYIYINILNFMEYVPKRYNTIKTSKHSDDNIIIAVLDTGVDPLAYGLTKNPDGSTKVIDIVDCTGSDIIDTSKVIPLNELPVDITNKINKEMDENAEIHYGIRSLKSFVSERPIKKWAMKLKK